MKKKSILSLLLAIVMLTSLVCVVFAEGEATAPAADQGGIPVAGILANPITMIVIMGLFFYFFLIRPEKKRKKETADMRAGLKVGDVITTIGGIMGRITSVKDEYIVIETGADKNKIKLAKWAVSTVDKKKEKAGKDQEADAVEETENANEPEEK